MPYVLAASVRLLNDRTSGRYGKRVRWVCGACHHGHDGGVWSGGAVSARTKACPACGVQNVMPDSPAEWGSAVSFIGRLREQEDILNALRGALMACDRPDAGALLDLLDLPGGVRFAHDEAVKLGLAVPELPAHCGWWW